jgi:hypothetical protein
MNRDGATGIERKVIDKKNEASNVIFLFIINFSVSTLNNKTVANSPSKK